MRETNFPLDIVLKIRKVFRMIQLTDKLIGQKFTAFDPNAEWTCVGWGDSGTQFIVGANWSQQDNRYTLNTFKLKDIKFKGQVPV